MAHAESTDSIRNETALIESLIEATQENLAALTKLRDLAQVYNDVQEAYLKNENDQENLFQMIKTAHAMLEIIKERQLAQSFAPDFIAELNVVSKPVSKLGIPKP